MYYNLRRHEFGLINKTRCCTLRRAKNTPTRSSVSRMVDMKQMCGKPGKGRHGTSHHAKAIYKYKIISSSRRYPLRKCERTDKRTDGQGDSNIAPSLQVGV